MIWTYVKRVALLTYSSQITKDPFVVKKCVLLLLRPDIFLPEDRPLLINTHRVLRAPGGPPLSASGNPLWTQYLPEEDHPYLVDPSGQDFEEFDFVSKRSQEQSLSVFSLLVDAHSKLQAAKKRGDFPPILQVYITNVRDAVEAIFFVPRKIQEECSDSDSGVVEGKHHASDADFEDVDYDFEEYEEEGDGPDTINGLAFQEMETVIQRASDGTIPVEERTEAALLMLGMAGGEPLLPSISSLSLPDSRHQAVDVHRWFLQ